MLSPRLERVAEVGQFDGHSEDKGQILDDLVSLFRVLGAVRFGCGGVRLGHQSSPWQELEPRDEVKMALQVRVQHHGNHVPPELDVLFAREAMQEIEPFGVQQGESCLKVMMLKDGRVRIAHGISADGLDLKSIRCAWVGKVMGEASKEGRQHVQGGDAIGQVEDHQKPIHRRHDVGAMHAVVVWICAIPALDFKEKSVEAILVDHELVKDAMSLQQVRKEDRHTVAAALHIELDNIEIPSQRSEDRRSEYGLWAQQAGGKFVEHGHCFNDV
jgi:hypothetical protein